ncbi:nucleotidyltransferase family protein [Candidatus Magnetomonas plexicatena]|uniref:nucleotidyltransferase family protein n=1 Tax=Candidatus Magnetomonas plexicatena TaxID=2552947 RepID=UPI004032C7A4
MILPKKEIAEFCKRHHIKKLSLFGSYLHGTFRPQSDIDLLVEFEPEHIPGLITLSSMELELSEIIGHKVDLRTPEDLSRYFRKEVVELAEVQYVQQGG